MHGMAPKRTPLYESHVKQGGKLVDFAGWSLPVQYTGVIPEHQAVRSSAGLFDVSHMGEILVQGPKAQETLNRLTCNDVASLYDGKAQYSAITNERGGVVDDIIIYRISAEKFFLCVNAANTERVLQWLTEHNIFEAKIENKSSEFGQIALQGPKAESILRRLGGGKGVSELKYFHFREMELLDTEVLVARTGYTGEDGFEIFIPWRETPHVWDSLLEAGKAAGILPCGLGARDSLRLEACYPLHGHELSEDVSAVESGLSWVIRFEKGDFIGRDVLLRHKKEGSPRSLVGFFVEDPGIARHGDRVLGEDFRAVGTVTSGTKTPTVGRALGLALVESVYGKLDTIIAAEVRGKRLRCKVVKRPFYKNTM